MSVKNSSFRHQVHPASIIPKFPLENAEAIVKATPDEIPLPLAVQDQLWAFSFAPTKANLTALLGEPNNVNSPLAFIRANAGDDITFSNDPHDAYVALSIDFEYSPTGLTQETPMFFIHGYNGTGLLTVQCPSLEDMRAVIGNRFPDFQVADTIVEVYRTQLPRQSFFHFDPIVDTSITDLTAHTLLDPEGFFTWLSLQDKADPHPTLLRPGQPAIDDLNSNPRIHKVDTTRLFTYTVHTIPVRTAVPGRELIGDLMQCIKGIGTYENDPTQVHPHSVNQARWFSEEPPVIP